MKIKTNSTSLGILAVKIKIDHANLATKSINHTNVGDTDPITEEERLPTLFFTSDGGRPQKKISLPIMFVTLYKYI